MSCEKTTIKQPAVAWPNEKHICVCVQMWVLFPMRTHSYTLQELYNVVTIYNNNITVNIADWAHHTRRLLLQFLKWLWWLKTEELCFFLFIVYSKITLMQSQTECDKRGEHTTTFVLKLLSLSHSWSFTSCSSSSKNGELIVLWMSCKSFNCKCKFSLAVCCLHSAP